MTVKPVHTSNKVEAKLSNATKSNVVSTLLPFLGTMSNEFCLLATESNNQTCSIFGNNVEGPGNKLLSKERYGQLCRKSNVLFSCYKLIRYVIARRSSAEIAFLKRVFWYGV